MENRWAFIGYVIMSLSESLSHSANTEDQSTAIHTELQQLVMCGCACMRMYVAASIHGAWHVLSKMSGAKMAAVS